MRAGDRFRLHRWRNLRVVRAAGTKVVRGYVSLVFACCRCREEVPLAERSCWFRMGWVLGMDQEADGPGGSLVGHTSGSSCGRACGMQLNTC